MLVDRGSVPKLSCIIGDLPVALVKDKTAAVLEMIGHSRGTSGLLHTLSFLVHYLILKNCSK